MRNVRYHGNEVAFVESGNATATRSTIEELKQRAQANERGRMRLCSHLTHEDAVQEMLIVLQKGQYIPPHRHRDKSESFHVIEGSLSMLIFDQKGLVLDVTHLGDYRSGEVFFFRINTDAYHSVVVHSNLAVIHETTSGPFSGAHTFRAPWAPSEDNPRRELYYRQMEATVHKWPSIRRGESSDER